MNRYEKLNSVQKAFLEQLIGVYESLSQVFIGEFNRSVSFGDVFVDRWDRAKQLGFGSETSIYDSSLVIGEVAVGKNCWIGPYTILDGSGKLEIGDFVTIAAGTHVYTHDNIKRTLSSGIMPIEFEKVIIGDNTYIAPNVVISKGVKIGKYSVIATGSFVNRDVPDLTIVAGVPAKPIGTVKREMDKIMLEYFQ
jgi:acetyltransferase-like isoleucine patch superfamily enzyme